MKIAFALVLFRRGLTVTALAPGTNQALHAHLEKLLASRAHTLARAVPLPHVAAGPVLHVDLAIVAPTPDREDQGAA